MKVFETKCPSSIIIYTGFEYDVCSQWKSVKCISIMSYWYQAPIYVFADMYQYRIMQKKGANLRLNFTCVFF